MRHFPLALTLISSLTLTLACANETRPAHAAKASPVVNNADPAAPGAPTPAPKPGTTTAPQPAATPLADKPAVAQPMDFIVSGTLRIPYSKLNKKHDVDIAAAAERLYVTDLVFQDGKMYDMLDILALRDSKGETAVTELLNNSCVLKVPLCESSAACEQRPMKYRDTVLKLSYGIHVFNAGASLDIPAGTDPNRPYSAKEDYDSEPLKGSQGFHQINCMMEKTLNLNDSLDAYTAEATLKQQFGDLLKFEVTKPALR